MGYAAYEGMNTEGIKRMYQYEANSNKRPEAAYGIKNPAPVRLGQNNTGIPIGMQRRFEAFSGFSFDDVKVHYNSDKPAQLQALAYTQGNRVYMASGQEKHLEHELGHVVQQKAGRIHATEQRGSLPVNTSAALEAQADAYARESRMMPLPSVPVSQPVTVQCCQAAQLRQVWAALSEELAPQFPARHLITEEQKAGRIGDCYRPRDVGMNTVILLTQDEFIGYIKEYEFRVNTEKNLVVDGGRLKQKGFCFEVSMVLPSFTFENKAPEKYADGRYASDVYRIPVSEWKSKSCVYMSGLCESMSGEKCVINHIWKTERV